MSRYRVLPKVKGTSPNNVFIRYCLRYDNTHLAQQNRYVRPILLQNKVTILTKVCKNRTSWRVCTLYRYNKRFCITVKLSQSIMYQQCLFYCYILFYHFVINIVTGTGTCSRVVTSELHIESLFVRINSIIFHKMLCEPQALCFDNTTYVLSYCRIQWNKTDKQRKSDVRERKRKAYLVFTYSKITSVQHWL